MARSASPIASGQSVSPDGMTDVSAKDLQLSLAKGGEAAMEALVENAKTVPGSVFETETVRALAQLANTNFPAWVNLRARLKSEARDVPLSDLDKRVRPSGGDASEGDDGLPGRPIEYHEINPWHRPVNGAELLTELAGAIETYVIMDAHQRDVVALWVVFTHAHDFFVFAARSSSFRRRSAAVRQDCKRYWRSFRRGLRP
jgi:hypothetical protein